MKIRMEEMACESVFKRERERESVDVYFIILILLKNYYVFKIKIQNVLLTNSREHILR